MVALRREMNSTPFITTSALRIEKRMMLVGVPERYMIRAQSAHEPLSTTKGKTGLLATRLFAGGRIISVMRTAFSQLKVYLTGGALQSPAHRNPML